jgi:hypothetical protein
VVTADDVVSAIEWCCEHHGIDLSSKNPANFIKDVIRGAHASAMWPTLLRERRITGRQLTGDGNIFEFVPYEAGQEEPFPDRFGPHDGVQRYKVQSVSVPLATKALGRNDETYLIQVALKLAVVETHFALFSSLEVEQISHLQIGIKQRRTEIDSLYAGVLKTGSNTAEHILITVEAKKKNQRILEEQIEQQVRAAFRLSRTNLVVPIAMVAAEDGIYVAEFKGVRRDGLAHFYELNLSSEALYELVPKVKGI